MSIKKNIYLLPVFFLIFGCNKDILTEDSLQSLLSQKFTYNEKFKYYKATLEGMNGVEVHVDAIDVETKAQAAERVAGIILWSFDNEITIKDYSASQLLDLKNGTWLDDGESVVSHGKFVRKLSITLISIDEDNSIRYYFDDGGLFFGHIVVVQTDEDRNFMYAKIEG